MESRRKVLMYLFAGSSREADVENGLWVWGTERVRRGERGALQMHATSCEVDS